MLRQRLVHDHAIHAALLDVGAAVVLPTLLADGDERTASAASKAVGALALNAELHEALIRVGLVKRILQQVAAWPTAPATRVAVDKSDAIKHGSVMCELLTAVELICQCVVPWCVVALRAVGG